MTTQQHLDDLRYAAFLAKSALSSAVEDACDGPHELKQHRDRKPAWCHTCARDALGRAQILGTSAKDAAADGEGSGE